MVEDDDIDSRNIALRLTTERSGFLTRIKSQSDMQRDGNLFLRCKSIF